MTGTSLSPYFLLHCSSSNSLTQLEEAFDVNAEEQFGDRGSGSHGLAQLKWEIMTWTFFFFFLSVGRNLLFGHISKILLKKKKPYHFLFISKVGPQSILYSGNVHN